MDARSNYVSINTTPVSYAPVIKRADGKVEVQLGDRHPGSLDQAYRDRRNAIAALAVNWHPGDPVPDVPYDEIEHGVWREVSREIAPLHQRSACREFLLGQARLGLPTDRIPQLAEVTASLEPLTGFSYVPAAGLVPLREFYETFGAGFFHSTQYVRHHSVPLYTPEPDVIHEVIGHGNCLANDRFAALYRAAGEAAARVQTSHALEFVSKVFWFSLEFGVVREDDEIKVYGAGILSSYGELGDYRAMDIRPLDLAAMGSTDYDITSYQPVLYGARSFAHVEDVIGGFFATCDDDSITALTHRKAHS
ncbi:MAG: Tyrosine 3-monooxygenase [Pseudonocardiales bacterium]|nr:Tyrosine 3-monooxygenase [Pseudonocardiales bacterium]